MSLLSDSLPWHNNNNRNLRAVALGGQLTHKALKANDNMGANMLVLSQIYCCTQPIYIIEYNVNIKYIP